MTQLAILYADRGDRRKSPGVPGAAMAIFADRRDRRLKSPISGMSDIGIRHVCPFPLLFRFAAAKVKQSGWVILPHDDLVVVWKMKLKCQITAIGVKNRLACPHQSMAKFARDFRWRSNSLRSAYKIARCVAVVFSISLKTCRQSSSPSCTRPRI